MKDLPSHRSLGTWIAGVFIVSGLGIIILASISLTSSPYAMKEIGGSSHQAVGPHVGMIAPNFILNDLSGNEKELLNGSQKPTLINFWATWCPPCVAEMATIQNLYANAEDTFRVIAVNADESTEVVQRFASEHNLSFDILLDPGGNVQELYRLRGYPTSFIIDGDGIVQIEHVGIMTEKKMREYLREVGVTQ
jgi:peroxiredoxin